MQTSEAILIREAALEISTANALIKCLALRGINTESYEADYQQSVIKFDLLLSDLMVKLHAYETALTEIRASSFHPDYNEAFNIAFEALAK